MNTLERKSEESKVIVDINGRLPEFVFRHLNRRGVLVKTNKVSSGRLEVISTQREVTRDALVAAMKGAGYLLCDEVSSKTEAKEDEQHETK